MQEVIAGSRGRRLVAIANRLPIIKVRGSWRAADGGLVTALRPLMDGRGGAWVGWDGGSSEAPARVAGFDIKIRPVSLNTRDARDYYYGFSNRSIWPLFHDLIEQPVFESRWWESYRRANLQFADAALAVSGGKTPPLLWVHDYHHMLLPAMLRGRRPAGPIAFFLHIPFPAPEIFSRLPWRSEVLEGLLGADLVAFQVDLYRDNFLRSCARLSSVEVTDQGVRLPDGRFVAVGSFPISIDAHEFAVEAKSERVERELHRLRSQFWDRKVLLGVDRLDYTKGVRHRIRALEQLFERRRDLRRSVAFVQIAIPSRDDVKEYRELRAEVEAEVGRINGRFTEPGHDVPFHYLYRRVQRPRLLAYYRLAHAAVVTPLKDGMNLIAKEFVVTQGATEGGAPLVLSEFAGAAHQLRGAILCNPYDVDDLSRAIEKAIEEPPEESRRRLEAMAESVHRENIYFWLDRIMASAESASRRGS